MKTLFEKDFVFGAATASYQIEGAWNEDGKTPSIWDDFCTQPERIERNENGKTACDHYHRYKEDVALMKEIGLQSYRFSLSWPRILPDGKGQLNPAGIAFYHNLLDELEDAGIEPLVTLFHWDLPLCLHKEYGGFASRKIVDDYVHYAITIFKEFKGRVRYYNSFNEPNAYSLAGHLMGVNAPGLKDMKTTNLVTHHQLLCHGMVYKKLKEIDPDARISISMHIPCVHPLQKDFRDFEAAQLDREFDARWFIDPLFFGKYPDKLASIMKKEGYYPETEKDDMNLIKGSSDFFCIQHYITRYVRYAEGENLINSKEVELTGEERTDMGWLISPYSFYDILKKFQSWYGDIPIFITENGIGLHDSLSPDGNVHDPRRIRFIQEYCKALLKAKQEGVNVKRYYLWSFLDNFEWSFGYRPRFGMVYVDYETQKRYLKDSALFYNKIIKTRGQVLFEEKPDFT